MEYIKAHNMEGSCMMSMYDKQVAYGQDHKLINNIRGEFNEYNDDKETFISESTTFNSLDDSNISMESSSSDLTDDASSSSLTNGPLYELQGLMDQLPIKRGLSKFYQGKSQSFTSLARVTSLEDLAKKETPYQKKLNASRSYGGGLNNSKSYTQLKHTISKKNSKGSFSNLSCLRRRNSFICTNRPPLSHVQSTF